MATITVTPGHTYGTTDTVTSTNLNDLGSPTAALTAGSILTADIADANVTTAKIADANVTFAKLTDVIDDDTMATATDTTLATSESIKAYVDDSGITQTTGSAPYYGCRAFASYNGITETLNNGANIVSVTRNSTADYTFIFDVAMPDTNYSVVTGGSNSGVDQLSYTSTSQVITKTTSSFRIKVTGGGPSGGLVNQVRLDVAVFR